METTIENATAAYMTLSKFAQEDMSISLAYKLKKALGETEEIFKMFEEKRVELLKKHGTEGDEGQFTFEDEEKAKAFTSGLEKVLKDTVEINTPKFSLGELENLTLSPMAVGAIEWLITEE